MMEPDHKRAREAVAAANEATGRRWRLRERLPGGLQSGAWLLVDDGAAAVLKVADTVDWARQVARAGEAVAIVRTAGYPTPEWLASGTTTGGVGYQVQSFVEGRSPDRLDVAAAEALIDVLEHQAGLDPDPERSWSGFVRQELGCGLGSLRECARSASAGGNRLVQVCDELLRFATPPAPPGTDMVHGDFRLGNVLMQGDQVTGVIDIEAIGSGTRAFDYATLLDEPAIDEDAVPLLVRAGCDAAGPGVLVACFVRVALDLAHFLVTRAIPTGDVERATRIDELTERARLVGRLTRPGSRR